jgi:adenosylcobinamide-GDP ribazoletransferase
MVADFMDALTFLTILPVPWKGSSSQPGRIFAFFPLVGALIGIIVYLIASIPFLPRDLVSFLALLGWASLTGGLHLDGFADACDGLLTTGPPERRLEIMKDPRAGSWAVVSLVLLLLGKWVALRGLLPNLAILPPILGRWTMVLAVACFPLARTSGTAAYFSTGFHQTQWMIATLLAVGSAALFGWRGLLSALISALTAGIGGRWAAARLGGGLTGDVYGGMCELVELLCLIVLNIA